MNAVLSMCVRAAWLDHGELYAMNSADEVVKTYQAG